MKRRRNAITIGGVRFANPVFLASGPAGYGAEYEGLIDLAAIGAVVTKTITLDPRRGNPGPRLRETEGGLLNSVGLENVGARAFFAEKLPALIAAGARPIVSLGAEDWKPYCALLEETASRSEVDCVELNLSCPNVERGGMAIGTRTDLVSRYVRRARKILGRRAILAKLTPNVADIAALASAASRAGADAVTAINTVVGMAVRDDLSGPVFARGRAGLSGPAIRTVALEAVWRISRAARIPVVGVGGISSVADARAFFAAGASAIQIGTAIFCDPALPERIIVALAKDGVPERMER